MDEEDYMVTSVDNPWNPFTNFDEWLAHDMTQGYNICGLLASFSEYSSALPDKVNEDNLDHAVNMLCNDVFPGLLIKVSPESFKDDGTIVPIPTRSESFEGGGV